MVSETHFISDRNKSRRGLKDKALVFLSNDITIRVFETRKQP